MARNFLSSLRKPKDGNLYGYYLPKALVDITITTSNNSIDLSVNGTHYTPDPDHHYYFRYQANNFSEDDITVKFNEKGFLSQVHTIRDDQTDEFISKLFDISSAFAPVPMTPVSPTPAFVQTRGTTTIVFSGKIDPFNEDDINRVDRALKQLDAAFSFKVLDFGDPKEGEEPLEGANPNDDTRSGIFCKSRTLIELGIHHPRGKETEILEVPSGKVLEFIAIPRAAWVKTEFDISFDDCGYPSSIHINKPSSAMELIQVPLNVLKALLDIPGRLFQFRINLNNVRAEAIKSDYNFKQEMLRYEERMKVLANASEGAANANNVTAVGSGQVRPLQPSSPMLEKELKNQADAIRKLEQDLEVLRKRGNQ